MAWCCERASSLLVCIPHRPPDWPPLCTPAAGLAVLRLGVSPVRCRTDRRTPWRRRARWSCCSSPPTRAVDLGRCPGRREPGQLGAHRLGPGWLRRLRRRRPTPSLVPRGAKVTPLPVSAARSRRSAGGDCRTSGLPCTGVERSAIGGGMAAASSIRLRELAAVVQQRLTSLTASTMCWRGRPRATKSYMRLAVADIRSGAHRSEAGPGRVCRRFGLRRQIDSRFDGTVEAVSAISTLMAAAAGGRRA